ncbi:MAG: hypothetical protein HYV09_35795 [Deltaproteobacteria bacterium]|nr:hypothetical protein [Deltaproteobacteria bacterium]
MAAPDPTATRAALEAAITSTTGDVREEGEQFLANLGRLAEMQRIITADVVANFGSTLDEERDGIDAALAAAMPGWEARARSAHEAADALCRTAEELQRVANLSAGMARAAATPGLTIGPEVVALIERSALRMSDRPPSELLTPGWSCPWEARERPRLSAKATLGVLATFAAEPGAAGNRTSVSFDDRGHPTSWTLTLPSGPVTRPPDTRGHLVIVVRANVVALTGDELTPRGTLDEWMKLARETGWPLGVRSTGLGAYAASAYCELAGGSGDTHAELLRRLARALTLPAASALAADLKARTTELQVAYAARPLRPDFGKGSRYFRTLGASSLGAVETELLDVMETAADWLAEVADA